MALLALAGCLYAWPEFGCTYARPVGPGPVGTSVRVIRFGDPPLRAVVGSPQRPQGASVFVWLGGDGSRCEPFDEEGWSRFARIVAIHGIVVIPETRKETECGTESWRTLNFYAQRLHELEALLGAVRAIPGVDAGRIILVGHSSGARVAARYAARHGGVAGLLQIADIGVCVKDMLAMKVKLDAARGELTSTAASEEIRVLEEAFARVRTQPADEIQWGGRPNSFWLEMCDDDELTRDYRHLTIPVLWFHGAADQVVPIESVKQLLGRLCQTGFQPYGLIELKNVGHLPPPAVVEELFAMGLAMIDAPGKRAQVCAGLRP